MTQYIDKAAIVAEIKRRISLFKKEKKTEKWSAGASQMNAVSLGARIAMLEEIKVFLDTLEIKEVDLDEEYIEEIYSHIDGIRDTADRMTSGNFMHHRAAIKFSANVIGQVLGLIGLKTQKSK